MSDYNFLNLSSFEFEELSRDLLQRHLNILLESFTSGRDKGIDLRYAGVSSKDIVVQSKRYSRFDELLYNLKKEVPKVVALDPKRYILTTSVGLTPGQKDQILSLFSSYIKSAADIFSKKDLNNLLGIFPEIEDQHFKLWLTSTNTLEKILKRKVYNQSKFEEEKVRYSINIYVQNNSYFSALKIIKEKKFVIISGIPGIGKTTLARILVYHFLAKGFEEFIFLSDSIKEGYDTYKEGKSQIFFFDDFLGRNFIGKILSNNEESRILNFIEKVRSSSNKILIFTTREYILSQAKQHYDLFNEKLLELAKCTIDLSHYTQFVRAKILYNHLFFSDIPQPYIENILDKENYKSIINHKNFSPRIIQTITKKELWENIKSVEFSKKLIEFLDYPSRIWQHVYEYQISNFSKYLLVNLMSAGAPILLEDLQAIMINFSNNHSIKYSISYSDLEFKKSIQELENTFIITMVDEIGQITIDYQNPSVLDFLISFFRQFPGTITDVISSGIFFNQLIEVFSNDERWKDDVDLKGYGLRKIVLNEEQRILFAKKVIGEYATLKSSMLQKVRYYNTKTFIWERKWGLGYYKLDRLFDEFEDEHDKLYREFFLEIFKKIIERANLDDLESEIEYFSYLKDEFRKDYVIDEFRLINTYFGLIENYIDFYNFKSLEQVFPESFKKFVKSRNYDSNKLTHFAMNFASLISDSDLEFWRIDIRNSGNKFDFKVSDALKILEKKINQNKVVEFYSPLDMKKTNVRAKEINIDKKIKNMFDGLLYDS